MLTRFGQVEPGTYFSDRIVPAAGVIVGDELIAFLSRHLHRSLL